jgi:hypothetical protein
MRSPSLLSRRYYRLNLPIAGALCLLAAAEYFWGAPWLQRLPEDYVAETRYAAKCRFRLTPTAKAEESELIARRRDQVLTSGVHHAIVQGDSHWSTPGGVASYEILSLYGVDRRTRENLPEYGAESRTGQYLFPLHLEQKSYKFWDPFYNGQCLATFDHAEEFQGLPVYVFNFKVEGIDDSAGYVALPDVPEKYRAMTRGAGRLWIEPQTGIVVEFVDSGASDFVDQISGKILGEVFRWDDRYTAETRAAQVKRAVHGRLVSFLLERWLPGGLVLAAMVCLAAGLRRREPLATSPLPLLEPVT